MYTPPAFRHDDLAELHGAIRASGLATLVTATAEGLVGTPLPLVLAADEGPFGTLYGHLARANPQARLPVIGEAMAIFAGPDAYVSPGWYPSKAEHGRVVPTWNYAAVHAYGAAEFYDDPGRLHAHVSALTARHEAGRAEPWAVTDAPEKFVAGQLRGIVGLRLPIARIEGKAKFSQNRGPEDRAGVVAGLRAEDDPAAAAAADRVPL
jgi:transcriptional regulator